MKTLLASLALGMIGGEVINKSSNSNRLNRYNVDVTKPEKPKHKGCGRYYYNEQGSCSKFESKVYFDAMKQKTAIMKFEKWRNSL